MVKFLVLELRLEWDFLCAEGLTNDGRFRALAASVAMRVDEFDVFGLVNVVWSFVKIGYMLS